MRHARILGTAFGFFIIIALISYQYYGEKKQKDYFVGQCNSVSFKLRPYPRGADRAVMDEYLNGAQYDRDECNKSGEMASKEYRMLDPIGRIDLITETCVKRLNTLMGGNANSFLLDLFRKGCRETAFHEYDNMKTLW